MTVFTISRLFKADPADWILFLLYSERPKLHRVSAILCAIELMLFIIILFSVLFFGASGESPGRAIVLTPGVGVSKMLKFSR